MSSIQAARYFSRQGLGLLRFSQEEGSFKSAGSLLNGSAFILTFVGVGVSTFSAMRLRETCLASQSKAKK